MAQGPATGGAPPPTVPLTFFALAGLGLAGFGAALVVGAGDVVASTRSPAALAAVHLGLLAAATVAVLGALHQFGPVVGGRALRSVTVARATPVLLAAGAVALAAGFAEGPEWLVRAGGAVAATAVGMAAWNLSAPLTARRDLVIRGLQASVAYLVLTAAFGVVYAFDRHHGWFGLLGHRVLAHAHLGLLGWLGLTYVAVTERLGVMFLSAREHDRRPGTVAVAALGAGTIVLTAGLLFDLRPVVVVGAVAVLAAAGAHLLSVTDMLRRRGRPLELPHGYVIAGSVALLAAAVFGIASGTAPTSTATREQLVAAEVGALFGWVALAIIGYSHRIVPFIYWRHLRERGAPRQPNGEPLLRAVLYDVRVATAGLAVAALAVALLVAGLALDAAGILRVAGGAFVAVAVATGLNFTLTPRAVAAAPEPEPASNEVPVALRSAAARGATARAPRASTPVPPADRVAARASAPAGGPAAAPASSPPAAPAPAAPEPAAPEPAAPAAPASLGRAPITTNPVVEIPGGPAMPDASSTLAALVAAVPERAPILDRLGLDYCCHGDQTLRAAASAAGLDEADVLRELAATGTNGEDDAAAEWRDLDAAALADHLEATHHAYLHEELPALDVLSAKVLDVHGDRHPELAEVRRVFVALKDELEPHLMKEERILFPAIRALAEGGAELPFGSVANPIRVMGMEHEQAGALLERLRTATSGYAVPADGCASYQSLYERLERFEHDTHMHIFKENELLFTKAIALEGSAR